jgi:hypothetical protein
MYADNQYTCQCILYTRCTLVSNSSYLYCTYTVDLPLLLTYTTTTTTTHRLVFCFKKRYPINSTDCTDTSWPETDTLEVERCAWQLWRLQEQVVLADFTPMMPTPPAPWTPCSPSSCTSSKRDCCKLTIRRRYCCGKPCSFEVTDFKRNGSLTFLSEYFLDASPTTKILNHTKECRAFC